MKGFKLGTLIFIRIFVYVALLLILLGSITSYVLVLVSHYNMNEVDKAFMSITGSSEYSNSKICAEIVYVILCFIVILIIISCCKDKISKSDIDSAAFFYYGLIVTLLICLGKCLKQQTDNKCLEYLNNAINVTKSKECDGDCLTFKNGSYSYFSFK